MATVQIGVRAQADRLEFRLMTEGKCSQRRGEFSNSGNSSERQLDSAKGLSEESFLLVDFVCILALQLFMREELAPAWL